MNLKLKIAFSILIIISIFGLTVKNDIIKNKLDYDVGIQFP